MTPTDAVTDYLARLDDALRDVPFGTAREIRAGIAEELGSLEPAAARARIDELGDPRTIAAEASAADVPAERVAWPPVAAAPSGYGRGPGHVAVTALLMGIGGLVLPVLGWIIGLVALWTGHVWTTFERWIATLAPPIAAAIAAGIWWLVQTGGGDAQTASMGPNPTIGFVATWWIWWLGASVGSVAIGIWLLVIGMRRVRA